MVLPQRVPFLLLVEHPLIYQTFTEHPLWARHRSRPRAHGLNRHDPGSRELTFWGDSTDAYK